MVEQAYPTGQSFRDAQITIAALSDPESRQAAERYLQQHGR